MGGSGYVIGWDCGTMLLPFCFFFVFLFVVALSSLMEVALLIEKTNKGLTEVIDISKEH